MQCHIYLMQGMVSNSETQRISNYVDALKACNAFSCNAEGAVTGAKSLEEQLLSVSVTAQAGLFALPASKLSLQSARRENGLQFKAMLIFWVVFFSWGFCSLLVLLSLKCRSWAQCLDWEKKRVKWFRGEQRANKLPLAWHVLMHLM